MNENGQKRASQHLWILFYAQENRNVRRYASKSANNTKQKIEKSALSCEFEAAMTQTVQKVFPTTKIQLIFKDISREK